MAEAEMSLDEFVTSVPRIQRSYVATLPENIREQLDIHRAKGTTVKTMVEWLKAIGFHDASQGKLEHYFKCYGDKG